MGTFVISKRFDDRYKFVFTSRKGKTIFTSPSCELKMECEDCIEAIKVNIEKYTYVKARAANGKYFFKMMLEETVIATSRKYTTPLLLEKGILYAPDYLINAGGLINCYSELNRYCIN